jgi:hypothetical protein
MFYFFFFLFVSENVVIRYGVFLLYFDDSFIFNIRGRKQYFTGYATKCKYATYFYSDVIFTPKT